MTPIGISEGFSGGVAGEILGKFSDGTPGEISGRIP